MKTLAYRCDICNKLCEEYQIKGVLNQPDLFSFLDSFPLVNAEKTNFHYCNNCYHERVENPVTLDKGRNNEDQLRANLHYILRKNTVSGRKK